MVVEPSDSAIDEVISVTLADRATAVRFLKAKNGDATQAINALFDDEDISEAEVRTPSAL